MKVIYQERCTGRTTDLINLCSRDRYSLIVAPNRKMCDAIFKQSKKLDKSIPQPITFKEFLECKYQGLHIDYFYFDNLDICLQQLTEVPIKAVVIEDKRIPRNNEPAIQEFLNAYEKLFFDSCEKAFLNPNPKVKVIGLQNESSEE